MKPEESVLKEIIDREWTMFHSVNEGAEKASCQEDRRTFTGMRRAQFAAWSPQAAESYLRDLTIAAQEGRNLAAEKYIHMMRHTAPAEYAQLKALLPPPDPAARRTADDITEKLVAETALLRTQYPCVSENGRPLRAQEDGPELTSIETYQRGELYTYSAATLELLQAHLTARAQAGGSLARDILENTMAYYGYPSLDAAEADLSARRLEAYRQAAKERCCWTGGVIGTEEDGNG